MIGDDELYAAISEVIDDGSGGHCVGDDGIHGFDVAEPDEGLLSEFAGVDEEDGLLALSHHDAFGLDE